MPRTRFWVPSSRDRRIRLRASSLQRWATFSPARWTTASRPLSASAGAGWASGSHFTCRLRESTVTSSPRACRAATSREPISPLAPVTVTRMLSVRACPGAGSARLDGAELLRVAGGVADLVPVGLGGALLLGLIGHGGRHGVAHVAVEHRRDDVVLAQVLVGHDRGDPARGGHLHLLGDLAGADVQRAPEDAGEAEDVVDLVR